MTDAPSGLRKSAIVLMSLGEQHATEVLRHMPPEAAQRVREEMARVGGLREVSLQTRQQVLAQFCTAAQSAAQPGAQSGAQASLASRTPCESQAASVTGFSDARISPPVPPRNTSSVAGGVLDSIRDEHPQTIALVLSHLPPEQASDVLAGLDRHKKVEVIKRIAAIENSGTQINEQAERGLRERLEQVTGSAIRPGGVTAAAEILQSSDEALEKNILDDLDAEAPSLAEQIRRVQAIFEVLIFADDEDIVRVIEQLDHETVSLALRAARPALKEKMLWNLPDEQAEQIEQEIGEVTPVAVSDIEAAQQRVAEVVDRLEAAGEIEVMNRGAHHEK